jgi:putative intracellular protease/amidase
MSAAPEPRDELPRLLSALADGTLDEPGEQRLAELLRTDPTARARYYDHVMLAALLRREGRRTAAQSGPTVLVGHDGGPTVPVGHEPESKIHSKAPTDGPPRSTFARPWLLVLAASLLLCLVLSVGEATGVTRLVPTMIRIVTGEGSLVIEVDDPSVSVQLDGEDVTITGAGIHELRLRPGTHKLVATKNGQPWREESVTIERGGKRILAVSRQPLAALDSLRSPLTDGDSTRTAESQKSADSPSSPASTRRPLVLMIVPSRDFVYAEVDPMRNQLAMHGVAWRIASSTLDECRPSAGGPPIQRPVKPDLLVADAQAADYDAIYFCGGKGCREFVGAADNSAAAQRLIDEALAANRTVAAMSIGVTVLAEAEVLPGRRVAVFPWDDDSGVVADRLMARGAICTEEPVVEDGPFLTGREPRDMQDFIRVFLRRLGIEPRRPP